MEHEEIVNQRNPETGEYQGYPAWTEAGYPVTALGVVLDCDPPCEKCAKRMAEIRDQYEAEMGDEAQPLSDYEASYLGDADEQERRADLENGPDWEAFYRAEANEEGWPVSRSERDCGV